MYGLLRFGEGAVVEARWSSVYVTLLSDLKAFPRHVGQLNHSDRFVGCS